MELESQLKILCFFGVQVMPYSTGCKTPLSNFEANSNYKVWNQRTSNVGFYHYYCYYDDGND